MNKQTIFNFIDTINVGYKRRSKILVFESDDWGAIRMRDSSSFNRLKDKGYPVDNCPYNSFDSIEMNDDVERLADVLYKHKDVDGEFAKFTLNVVMSNPNFDKIKASGYEKYSFQKIKDTYEEYPNSDRVLDLIQSGKKNGIFQVQYHGREHLNVSRWLSDLRGGFKPLMDVFEERMYSPKLPKVIGYDMEYMDAYDSDSQFDSQNKALIANEGLNMFKDEFGFSSTSFIAPCYRWNEDIEKLVSKNNIRYLQGIRIQCVSYPFKTYQYKTRRHFMSQKNIYGQTYFVRNVFFEPSTKFNFNWVDSSFSFSVYDSSEL